MIMIDGKKIEEAARKYAFNKYDSTDDEIEGYTIELQMAFEEGINWFLDNLWHDASEEPEIPNEETYVACLVKYKNKSTELCIYWLTDGWTCNTMCHRAFMENFDSWLYINDLLK